MPINAKKICTIGVVLLAASLLKVLIDVIVLEPLGVYDIHVSRVPEGPHNCIKVSEEWYRNCWNLRERSPLFPIKDDSEQSP